MAKRKLKILLTGSAGYIGSSLKEKYGRFFDFVDYDIRGHPSRNVLDLALLKKLVRKADGVVHLAAISRPKWGFDDPYLCLVTNVLGTLNVLEAVREVNPDAWVILGSSREVFGNLKKLPGDEKSPREPLNSYGVSKVCGEDLLKQYADNYRLRCLTLRFCGVYTGKGDILERVVPKFILRAFQGKPLEVEGDGKKKFFDFVYISDTLLGIVKAIRFISQKNGGFYDDVTLAANSPISIYNLADIIIRLAGSRSKIKFTRGRSYDQNGYWGKYAKARELLGWKPQVSIKDGLKRAIKDLKPLVRRERYTK